MADQVTSRIPDDLDGARLDKALATILDVSRGVARDLIERGAEIDGEPARPGTRVRSGAMVVCEQPRLGEGLDPEPIDFGVLYEDQAVVVVDKPAGLVVHPGTGRNTGTLASGLLYRYPEIEGVGTTDRWGLVHRLDKDTSGALLVARTASSYESLTRQIRNREVKRGYLALVDGVPGSPTGTIDAPIGRDAELPTRRAVTRDGKPARTHFAVEEAFVADRCSLLRLQLETGRTHQIRVHLASIGHPVIADPVYGRNTSVGSPRIFLHASSLEFAHPLDGRTLHVDSPLPDDLGRVLEGITADKSDDSIPSGP